MDTLNNKEYYYQCIKCGNIHRVNIDKIFDLKNDLYYATKCNQCRGVTKHLCVGENEMDKYEFYDPVLDERYY